MPRLVPPRGRTVPVTQDQAQVMEMCQTAMDITMLWRVETDLWQVTALTRINRLEIMGTDTSAHRALPAIIAIAEAMLQETVPEKTDHSWLVLSIWCGHREAMACHGMHPCTSQNQWAGCLSAV